MLICTARVSFPCLDIRTGASYREAASPRVPGSQSYKCLPGVNQRNVARPAVTARCKIPQTRGEEPAMLHTLAEKVDPRRSALLVVDVQNDFCHEDGASAKNGWDVRPAQAMIPTLNRLIEECRGAGLPVIFVRVTHSSADDSDVWRERQ